MKIELTIKEKEDLESQHVGRNNRVFKTAAEFRQAINDFFAKWPKIALSMVDRINDNFQILNKVS